MPRWVRVRDDMGNEYDVSPDSPAIADGGLTPVDKEHYPDLEGPMVRPRRPKHAALGSRARATGRATRTSASAAADAVKSLTQAGHPAGPITTTAATAAPEKE